MSTENPQAAELAKQFQEERDHWYDALVPNLSESGRSQTAIEIAHKLTTLRTSNTALAAEVNVLADCLKGSANLAVELQGTVRQLRADKEAAEGLLREALHDLEYAVERGVFVSIIPTIQRIRAHLTLPSAQPSETKHEPISKDAVTQIQVARIIAAQPPQETTKP